MKKFLQILVCSSMLFVGPCVLDSWNLAFGPMVNGETLYGGVELEFSNGIDFIVPLAELGDNLNN